MNTQILELILQQGWLNQDQERVSRSFVEKNPDRSLLDFFIQQAWFADEHLQWIRQTLGISEVGSAGGVVTVASPTEMPLDVHDYLKLARSYEASDLHLGVAAPPLMRRHGRLVPLWDGAANLTAQNTEQIMMRFLTEAQRSQLKQAGDLDFCYSPPRLGRYRTSVVRHRLGYDAVFRIINERPPTMDELGLPAVLKGLTKYHNGLVLVTGPMGSGKSTTLAALVEEVNRDRHDHIITLEDPIEYVFEPKGCQITQRELHSHTESFSTALRAALREDPDVIMIGEMRDLETISLAITASETGHLVFGTLHTGSAARTLDRILNVFPPSQQAQIRTMVAGSLRGIISQQLVPRVDGNGRCLAMEILIQSPASMAVIRDGKTFMLPGIMQTGRKIGCRMMDDVLMELVHQQKISGEEAYERAEQKSLFKQYLSPQPGKAGA